MAAPAFYLDEDEDGAILQVWDCDACDGAGWQTDFRTYGRECDRCRGGVGKSYRISFDEAVRRCAYEAAHFEPEEIADWIAAQRAFLDRYRAKAA